jgi:hypothetical protein
MSNDPYPLEAWRPTLGLRFVKRLDPYGSDIAQTIHVLQQQWESTYGRLDWRDVPLEDA